MRDRFDNVINHLYRVVECLRPRNAISKNYHSNNKETFNEIITVFKKLTVHVDVEELKIQWSYLPQVHDVPKEPKEDAKINEFWTYIQKVTDEEEKYFFYDLASIVLAALGIPNANAEVERMFSLINDSKNKKTNQMENDTVGGTLRIRQAVNQSNKATIEPAEATIDRELDSKFCKSTEPN